MGLLRPADFAHTRSQSNRICTLPETYFHPAHFSHLWSPSLSQRLIFHLSSQKNTVPWTICHFLRLHFNSILPLCTAKWSLKALWFVFAPKSLEEPEERNMTSFTIVVLCNHMYEKGSQVLPAHVALLMHLPVIFHTGLKIPIPLATQKPLNVAFKIGTLGRIAYSFQLWYYYKPQNIHKNVHICIPVCILPDWTCSPEPPQPLLTQCPVNRFIYHTNTPYRKRKETNFAL